MFQCSVFQTSVWLTNILLFAQFFIAFNQINYIFCFTIYFWIDGPCWLIVFNKFAFFDKRAGRALFPTSPHASCLHLLIHLLQNLNLLLKHVGRKLSCCSNTSSTGKFRSHCSWDREERGSSKAIACHFARRYFSAASSNFFEHRVLAIPGPGLSIT